MTKIIKSETPESDEILAISIVKLGDAVARLDKSGLNRKAIVVLLRDATKMSAKQINTVLDAIPRLREWYLKV